MLSFGRCGQETTPHHFGRLFYLVNFNLCSQFKMLKLGRRSSDIHHHSMKITTTIVSRKPPVLNSAGPCLSQSFLRLVPTFLLASVLSRFTRYTRSWPTGGSLLANVAYQVLGRLFVKVTHHPNNICWMGET